MYVRLSSLELRPRGSGGVRLDQAGSGPVKWLLACHSTRSLPSTRPCLLTDSGTPVPVGRQRGRRVRGGRPAD